MGIDRGLISSVRGGGISLKTKNSTVRRSMNKMRDSESHSRVEVDDSKIEMK